MTTSLLELLIIVILPQVCVSLYPPVYYNDDKSGSNTRQAVKLTMTLNNTDPADSDDTEVAGEVSNDDLGEMEVFAYI